MLKEVANILSSMLVKTDLELLKEIKDYYNKANETKKFYIDIAGGWVAHQLLELVKGLQDFSNSLQYNLLNMYITHPAFKSPRSNSK
jgi:hypothetical protein